jgi:4-hydroxy-tetrahydrodipicolinate synthase
MNLRGFDGGSVRQPLRDLEPAKVAQVAEVLRAMATDQRSNVALAA